MTSAFEQEIQILSEGKKEINLKFYGKMETQEPSNMGCNKEEL